MYVEELIEEINSLVKLDSLVLSNFMIKIGYFQAYYQNWVS